MSNTIKIQEILGSLIGFNTVSAFPNKALIDYLLSYLNKFGIRLGQGKRVFKANLFATIGPNSSGGIVLSGHTDVVPVSKGWSTDPFVA